MVMIIVITKRILKTPSMVRNGWSGLRCVRCGRVKMIPIMVPIQVTAKRTIKTIPATIKTGFQIFPRAEKRVLNIFPSKAPPFLMVSPRALSPVE